MPDKTTVCRCPKCGSTEAYCDEARSVVDLSYMVCPACENAGLADSWEVAEDWLVDLVLETGEPIPSKLPPLKPGEYLYEQLAKVREERGARTKWRLLGTDTFAREDYIIGAYDTEAEAKQAMAEHEARHALTQDEALRDTLWILKVEAEET